MYKNGFLKVALITPKLEVGNPTFNVNVMLEALSNLKTGIALFPELSITGYSCGDLFYQDSLINQAKDNLKRLIDEHTFDGVLIVGLPLDVEGCII